MTKTKLTEPQQRAVDWLPKDGSWRAKPGRLVAALNSFCLFHRSFGQMEIGDFGPRGGRCWRYRLTPAGVAMFHAADVEEGGASANRRRP